MSKELQESFSKDGKREGKRAFIKTRLYKCFIGESLMFMLRNNVTQPFKEHIFTISKKFLNKNVNSMQGNRYKIITLLNFVRMQIKIQLPVIILYGSPCSTEVPKGTDIFFGTSSLYGCNMIFILNILCFLTGVLAERYTKQDIDFLVGDILKRASSRKKKIVEEPESVVDGDDDDDER